MGFIAQKLATALLSFLSANALQFLFDLIDEAAESVLEKQEAKARNTPDKADDRRLAVLRRYFEGWKSFKK